MAHPVEVADQIQYLTDAEINSFLDSLDHNADGLIDYSEVEAKLDAAHDELVPKPQAHHILARRPPAASSPEDGAAKAAAGPEADLRHQFLRSIIGSDARRIPRAEFAERVKEWKIPSLEQDKKEQGAQAGYVKKMTVWRRLRAYWAVHGPEIGFLALVVSMQLAFGIWQCVKYATGQQYQAAFGWGVALAKTCAGALYPTMFFLIISMSRYFSTFLRRSYYVSRFVNWDFSQAFHIRISIVAICLASLHAIGHLTGSFNWGSRPENEAAVAALLGPDAVPRPYVRYVRSLPGWTGLTALGCFYVLALLSIPPVRRRSYEIFQLGHLLMFPIFGLLAAHGTAGLLQWPMLGYWIAFPTLLVVTERLVRISVGFHRIKATLRVLDGETVEITVTIPSERLWKYKAGQYVFLQVPKISLFQWHPFTVSVCVGKKMQLHIKTDGNWTGKLRGLVNESGAGEIEVGINGPFGAPAQRFYEFNHSIIVGSGIGVTPFSGILTDLQAKENTAHGGPAQAHAQLSDEPIAEKPVPDGSKAAEKQPLERSGQVESPAAADKPAEQLTFPHDYRRVDFHWTVRDRNYLLWMSDLLNDVSRSQQWHRAHDASPHLDIRLHTHVTQKRSNLVTHVYRWLLEIHRTEAHPASPITGLLNPTHFGRPDFVRILDDHYEDMLRFRASKRAERERHHGRSSSSSSSSSDNNGDAGSDDGYAGEEDEELKVGVFYCGAPVVGEILADRCAALTARGRADGSKVEYHFMMEVFG